MIHSRRSAVGAMIGGLAATAALRRNGEGRTATVILVRHAEKMDGADPALSARGRERAAALARLLEATTLTRIYTTDYRRTRETVAPAAGEGGVETYDARDSAGFASVLSGLEDGSCVLAAGHSNTVPAIVQALGGELAGLDERGFLDESAYDRLVVVTLHSCGDEPMSAVMTLDLRYSGEAGG